MTMGIDVPGQVAYWQEGAREDLETARILLDNNRINHGFFWAHLAIEKALKALVVRQTEINAPFIHDLVRLATLANLSLTDEQRGFLAACNRFAIHGRYGTPQSPVVTPEEVATTWDRLKEMVQWLLAL